MPADGTARVHEHGVEIENNACAVDGVRRKIDRKRELKPIEKLLLLESLEAELGAAELEYQHLGAAQQSPLEHGCTTNACRVAPRVVVLHPLCCKERGKCRVEARVMPNRQRKTAKHVLVRRLLGRLCVDRAHRGHQRAFEKLGHPSGLSTQSVERLQKDVQQLVRVVLNEQVACLPPERVRQLCRRDSILRAVLHRPEKTLQSRRNRRRVRRGPRGQRHVVHSASDGAQVKQRLQNNVQIVGRAHVHKAHEANSWA
eukprot:Amastigsp_a184658_11.p3 type:complete len:257 gc:universal Amastigsp_a184658_11:357-1127(+)